MRKKIKFENSLACIDYWAANPYHPIIKPILETIGDIDEDFKYITGVWGYPEDFKKANICILQFENYLISKLGKKFFKKNYATIKGFVNSRSWKSLPFEVSDNKETIYFHHSIPLRIPSKWNIFQFEDLLSLYLPYFHAGISKKDLIKREREFKLISKILRVYFEHPSIISIVTHYNQAKEDFIKFIGGDGVKKLKVIEPFVKKNNSIISPYENSQIKYEFLKTKKIRILFTGSHHGNPGNLLSRGIQYTLKFASDLSKILIEKNLNSIVELNLIAPSSSRIKDYIGPEGLSEFKKEIKRVSEINYGETNPNPKLKINYVVNRISNNEMSFLKDSSNLYPDFAGTVHTSSIFEAFSSKVLYLGLRKDLTSEITDELKSNEEGLFIQNNLSSNLPSSITQDLEEEQNIYGKNYEKISNLALNALNTIENKDLLDQILNQQSKLFDETSKSATLKWNSLLEDISSNNKYIAQMKDYNEELPAKNLLKFKRATKIQTIFYRNIFLATTKKFSEDQVTLFDKFKISNSKIMNYSSYPDSDFTDTTYTVSKFDLLMKVCTKTNLSEVNAQLSDIFYILLDIIPKSKSIYLENSKQTHSLTLNEKVINNYYFPGIKKTKIKFIKSLKHTLNTKIKNKLLLKFIKYIYKKMKFIFFSK